MTAEVWLLLERAIDIVLYNANGLLSDLGEYQLGILTNSMHSRYLIIQILSVHILYHSALYRAWIHVQHRQLRTTCSETAYSNSI